MGKSDIKIRKANIAEVNDIHEVLLDAFEPYKRDYTEQAFQVTVMSPLEIEKRMNEKNSEVWVVINGSMIVGTVSLNWDISKKLHLRSMAIRQNDQGKGIGWMILEEVIRFAKAKGSPTLSLESFEPLTQAIKLYEKFGFKRKGRERQYYGIKIFEMVKHINDEK